MRRPLLAASVWLLLASCVEVRGPAEFLFQTESEKAAGQGTTDSTADGTGDTEVSDAAEIDAAEIDAAGADAVASDTDVSETEGDGGPDTIADTADSLDAVDTEDAVDTVDAADTADTQDTGDAGDGADGLDTPDTEVDAPSPADVDASSTDTEVLGGDAEDGGDAAVSDDADAVVDSVIDAPDGSNDADAVDDAEVSDPCLTLNCADNDPCTLDNCLPFQGCNHSPDSGAVCSVGPCQIDGTCVQGTCKFTTLLSCEDQNDCTVDSCEDAIGCVNTPLNNGNCVGSACMTAQTCKAGVCQGGVAKVCKDGDVCTSDGCVEGKGCDFPNNTATCDDGAACTILDVCAGGSCQGQSKFADVTYGGTGVEGVSRVLAVSGGLTLVGSTSSTGAGGSDVWLANTDLAGNLVWQKTFGGADNDVGLDAAVLADGYALVGHTQTATAAGGQLWLARTGLQGELLWEQALGGVGDDDGTALLAEADGLSIAGGTNDGQDGWLVHVDLSGGATWTMTYGGTGVDRLNALGRAGDGYVLAGGTQSQGAGNEDFWLIRTDAAGNLLWQQTYGGANFDRASGVVVLADGFLMAGTTRSKGAGDADAWLVRTDKDGVKLWDKTYGGKVYDDAVQIASVPGGFAFTGTTASTGAGGDDMWLVRTDHFGNKVFGFPYGGPSPDGATRFALLPDGFALAGYTVSKGAGGADAWLLRTDLFGSSTCATSGSCVTKVVSDCGDGNECTTDLCDAIHNGCYHGGGDGALCDDAAKCTGPDVCTAKSCAGPPLVCADANDCTLDSCDDEFGCVFNDNNAATCNDGNVCTSTDTCQIHTCVGTPTSGTTCNDGLLCTGPDACSSGVCQGAPVDCSDTNPCTADACDPILSCVHLPLVEVTPCNDGDACTLNDACSGGTCSGTVDLCDDSSACTADTCDELAGCQHTPEVPCVVYADVQPIYASKCSSCHTGGSSGGHNIGSTYGDALLSSYYCNGKKKGECTIVRIQDGTMPQGKGCSGNPTTDAAKPECLTAPEQALIQAWIDGGLKP